MPETVTSRPIIKRCWALKLQSGRDSPFKCYSGSEQDLFSGQSIFYFVSALSHRGFFQKESDSSERCLEFPVMRLLGRPLAHPFVQDYIKSAPLPVVIESNHPRYVVEDGDEKKSFSIEEITGLILANFKRDYDDVAAVVLIVPHDFGEEQRRALKVAIDWSGLNVTHLITPTMAVAYSFNIIPAPKVRKFPWQVEGFGRSDWVETGCFLFFHLDKETLNISVIAVDKENGTIEIKSGVEDSQLGENKFMDRMAKKYRMTRKLYEAWAALNYKKWVCFKEDGILVNPPRKLLRLPGGSGNCTCICTCSNGSSNGDGYRLSPKLIGEQCADLFNRVKELVTRALDEAGLERSDYKYVQMFGEYCRIPNFGAIIRDALPNSKLSYYGVPAEELFVPGEQIAKQWSYLKRERDYEMEGASCMAHILNDGHKTYFFSEEHPEVEIPHRNLRVLETRPHHQWLVAQL